MGWSALSCEPLQLRTRRQAGHPRRKTARGRVLRTPPWVDLAVATDEPVTGAYPDADETRLPLLTAAEARDAVGYMQLLESPDWLCSRDRQHLFTSLGFWPKSWGAIAEGESFVRLQGGAATWGTVTDHAFWSTTSASSPTRCSWAPARCGARIPHRYA